MEILAKLAFALHSLIILGGAALAVGSSSLVRALVGLIVTFIGVAGMYLLLNTPFLAFMQLLIYVGAVCVLIFFAVMLARADAGGDEADPKPAKLRLYAILAGVLPAGLLAALVVRHPALQTQELPVEIGIDKLGAGLLGQYAMGFELISLILLVAMAGAVLVAWEKKVGK